MQSEVGVVHNISTVFCGDGPSHGSRYAAFRPQRPVTPTKQGGKVYFGEENEAQENNIVQ